MRVFLAATAIVVASSAATARADGVPTLDAGDLTGFPAISADGESILLDDSIEYRDPRVAVWSVRAGRIVRRIVLPARDERAASRRVELIRAMITRDGYRSMTQVPEMPVGCDAPCTSLVADVAHVELGGATLRIELPRRRLLLGDPSDCAPGGPRQPPFRARVWTDETRTVVIVGASYEAYAHGCELETVWRGGRVAPGAPHPASTP